MILVTVEIKVTLTVRGIYEAIDIHEDHVIFSGTFFEFIIHYDKFLQTQVDPEHDINFKILNVADLGTLTDDQLELLRISKSTNISYLENTNEK